MARRKQRLAGINFPAFLLGQIEYFKYYISNTYRKELIMQTVFLQKTDITQLNDVDVIVNAANSTLLGGGGVDGAIHRAAGPGLLAECRTLGGCQIAEVKLTSAYNLLCKGIIHTVGPIWKDNLSDKVKEEKVKQLYNCYMNAMVLAGRHKFESIAFPSISTRVYHFPVEKADYISLQAVKDYFSKHPESTLTVVKLVYYSDEDFETMKNVARTYNSEMNLDIWICENSSIFRL